MAFKKSHILFSFIIGLAVFGLMAQLILQPARLFINLLMAVGIGIVIFFIFYLLFRSRISANEMKKYRKAVRQSKAKYSKWGNQDKTAAKKQPSLIRKKRRNAAHLRVIDGNKSKRKNRASF